jgi:hypothetical protein
MERAPASLTPRPWPFPCSRSLLPVRAHVTAGSAQISFPDRRSPAGNKQIRDPIAIQDSLLMEEG